MALDTHITQGQLDQIIGWIVSGFRGGKDRLLLSPVGVAAGSSRWMSVRTRLDKSF